MLLHWRGPAAQSAGRALVLPIPTVRQTMDKSCGVACCCAIIGWHRGVTPTDRALAARHRLSCGTGTVPHDWRRVLQAEIGADVTGRPRLTLAVLETELSRARPLILTVSVGRERYHAVVASGLVLAEEGTAYVAVNDPTIGMRLLTPLETVRASTRAVHAVEI